MTKEHDMIMPLNNDSLDWDEMYSQADDWHRKQYDEQFRKHPDCADPKHPGCEYCCADDDLEEEERV